MYPCAFHQNKNAVNKEVTIISMKESAWSTQGYFGRLLKFSRKILEYWLLYFKWQLHFRVKKVKLASFQFLIFFLVRLESLDDQLCLQAWLYPQKITIYIPSLSFLWIPGCDMIGQLLAQLPLEHIYIIYCEYRMYIIFHNPSTIFVCAQLV